MFFVVILLEPLFTTCYIKVKVTEYLFYPRDKRSFLIGHDQERLENLYYLQRINICRLIKLDLQMLGKLN